MTLSIAILFSAVVYCTLIKRHRVFNAIYGCIWIGIGCMGVIARVIPRTGIRGESAFLFGIASIAGGLVIFVAGLVGHNQVQT
jgi:heme O synthase-like polyprenyltransferase